MAKVESPNPSNDNGPPFNWRAYCIYATVLFLSPIFGGCINRYFARSRDEQMAGKMEELRIELKLNRERNPK